MNSFGLLTTVRAQSALNQASANVKSLRSRVADRFAEDRGAALAEYGLLLALIALVAVLTLALFGARIIEVFEDAEQTLAERDNVPETN